MTSPTQSTGTLASSRAAIGGLVEPLVTAAGLELWDVEINPRAVRVLVDRPGGVDLESLGPLAKAVSIALDDHNDLTPGSQYELEVSSPGVERTLRTPHHYQRFVGTEISVKTDVSIAGSPSGSRRVQGILRAADDRGITIGLAAGPAELGYDQIQKAHTVLNWGPSRPTKKGAPRSAPKGASSARSEPKKAEFMKDPVT